MREVFQVDEWKIIESPFHPEHMRFTESIFSLANEYMGLRGNFEEQYSGDSLQGTYIAGVYEKQPTRVGWWKIGYPEYVKKIINSPNWLGIRVLLDGNELDLLKWPIISYSRELDMRNGVLTRRFVVQGPPGQTGTSAAVPAAPRYQVEVQRFLSLADRAIAAIRYCVVPLDGPAEVTFMPFIDGKVINEEDRAYGLWFWREVGRELFPGGGILTEKTRNTGFAVSTAMRCRAVSGRTLAERGTEREHFVGWSLAVQTAAGKAAELEKIVASCSSRDFPEETLAQTCRERLERASQKGFATLLEESTAVWAARWQDSDIEIKGDPVAQQAIRYCIFQLTQHFAGTDPRLNIAPKGLTGERYWGVTYWDTEAFCLPFYLYTNPEVARNLLRYRHYYLPQAKANAARIGLRGALYPMATIDGEECHNEWEITMEEIHRNGAIAYAIAHYVQYTGDRHYLVEYGLDVLVELCRFWESRVSYSPRKGKYVILNVTGPDEYKNNVDNNWYTNTMAAWTLSYTLKSLAECEAHFPAETAACLQRLQVSSRERSKWSEIAGNMYTPYDPELGIFPQDDTYLEKIQGLAKDLPASELPLTRHWSWDRIQRHCYLKQADVCQGLLFLGDHFDEETKRRNYRFYADRTVHGSSLSPCVYSILASELGYEDEAYQLYLRGARLDLEDRNGDSDEGIHLTSMGGTWMTIVQGFAGLRVKDGRLSLRPFVPNKWQEFSFHITFRGRRLHVRAARQFTWIEQQTGPDLDILVHGRIVHLQAGGSVQVQNPGKEGVA
ncbi:MAG: glycoside hydrolase family 65 protein [Firmicutes bacterium]|nr:glycoside hydrolase family 65 protein [Bacillota bacterium]